MALKVALWQGRRGEVDRNGGEEGYDGKLYGVITKPRLQVVAIMMYA